MIYKLCNIYMKVQEIVVKLVMLSIDHPYVS